MAIVLVEITVPESSAIMVNVGGNVDATGEFVGEIVGDFEGDDVGDIVGAKVHPSNTEITFVLLWAEDFIVYSPGLVKLI